jgi:hypothetical protein
MPNSSSGSNFVHFSFLGNFFGKKKWWTTDLKGVSEPS